MKQRILCLALCVCMLVSLVPVASAAPTPESLTDCTIEVIFGGALTRQAVKRDADGVYYAPITWISYFGPNVVHEELPEAPGISGNITEGWHLFYLKEQEEYGPFARRTFINEESGKFIIALGADLEMQARFVAEAKDFGTWKERGTLLLSPPHVQQQMLNDYFSRADTQIRRINEEYIISTEGTFSSVVKIGGETWVPMNEILALADVNGSVTEDGKYLCMQPVQDSLLRFLYRRWGELKPLVFDEGDIIGEDVMAAGGWIVATASGRGGFYIGGMLESYNDLFTAFLTDDEAYLAAFDAEADPDMEYMEQVGENAGELNNIFQDFSKRMEPTYRLILSGETDEMKDHYKSYFAPGKATASAIGALVSLGQYAHVYLNQIDDHREMLHAVYFYEPNPEWPSYLAAKSVINSYRDGSQKITAKFWETVNQTVSGLISDGILLSKVGPWYLFLKVGTLFMGDDYQYVLDSSHVDENLKVSTYSYQVFEERIFTSQLKGLHPNAIRLSLMLALISSRHAYKTYWSGTDFKADTIAQIDEILAELYTAGRWQDIDAKDIWYVSKDALTKELADLLPADGSADPDTDTDTDTETNSNTSVMDYLLNTTDPSIFPAGTLEQDGSMYTGSFGKMKVQFKMGTDDFGEPCITYLGIQPNGVEFPFAYGLTTTSTMLEFIDGMRDLCESTLVPLPEIAWRDSWFGPYVVHSNDTFIGEEQYEASNYWVVDSRVYQIVISGGAKGHAAPDSINLFLCSSK